MPALYLKLAGAAVVLLALAGIAGWIHHQGYVAGEAAKEAHYAPILAAVQRERDSAIARVAAQDGASARISADTEARHAQTVKDLTDRADAARLAMLGSLRKLATLSRSCAVPGVPGSPAVPPGTSTGPDRPDAVAGRIAATGRSCEHDAAELAGWLDWYTRQKALAAHP